MRILAIGLICVVLSCTSKRSHEDANDNEKKEFSPDDASVKRAFRLAQDSLPFFVETFIKFQSQQEYNFFIKAELTKHNMTEHLWSRPFLILNNEFMCVLDSNPATLEGYKFGDTIRVDFNTVEDYMIILGDSVIGNYLQKELKKKSARE